MTGLVHSADNGERVRLSPAEHAVFGAVADALLPALPGDGRFWASSATDLGIAARLPAQVARLPDDRTRAELAKLLRTLDSALGGLILYGRPRRFRDLSANDAEAALRRMAGSRFPQRRQAFQALKRLIAIVAVTAPDMVSPSLVWADIGYPGPDDSAPATPGPIVPVAVREDSQWECDVVVVGSGAGGGTAAGVLAAAGLSVVIMEKGPYVAEKDFTHLEHDAYARLYLDGNLAPTADLGIGMQAGSCLGGGTVINYTVSLATPDHVRREWDRISGLAGVFSGADYEDSSRLVHLRVGVNTDHSAPSNQEALMQAGLKALGWHVDDVPRDVIGCPQDDFCGHCTMGCRRGAVRSVTRTWLEDAYRAGARIVVNAEVLRVLVEQGRAVGVEARVAGASLTVRARAVVLACGGLYTPALLRRSGADGRAVGETLWLHPTTAVWGRFAQEVRPWTGTVHSKYGAEFADLDGEHYGVTFEVGPSHPVVAALAFGWESGQQYKSALLEYPHWSAIGVRLRDRDHGRVEVPKAGRPIWHYRVSQRDQAHVRHGIQRAAEVLAAAGAEEVMTTSGVPIVWRPGSREPVESFAGRVDAIGYDRNGVLYASYHQMGSARMGSNRNESVIGENNEVHDTPALYVLDASAFPATSGVNPMITIEALAHRGAKALADRLT
jgi:long-chain-alcohol oxidase